MGLVTLSSFLMLWGWVFIIVTTLIALFKHEVEKHNTRSSNEQSKGFTDIVNAYKQLYAIIKLPAVRTLALVLITAKVGIISK